MKGRLVLSDIRDAKSECIDTAGVARIYDLAISDCVWIVSGLPWSSSLSQTDTLNKLLWRALLSRHLNA